MPHCKKSSASTILTGKHLKTGDGPQRVVRHGHLPEREVMTEKSAFLSRKSTNLGLDRPGE
jgi:hypothetical protein